MVDTGGGREGELWRRSNGVGARARNERVRRGEARQFVRLCSVSVGAQSNFTCMLFLVFSCCCSFFHPHTRVSFILVADEPDTGNLQR